MVAEWRPSGGRVAVKYRPGVCRHACRFMSTDTRPSLGRHIGRVSIDISVECRSPYRPIVSTDTRSTDALSTHDPDNLTKKVMFLISSDMNKHALYNSRKYLLKSTTTTQTANKALFYFVNSEIVVNSLNSRGLKALSKYLKLGGDRVISAFRFL